MSGVLLDVRNLTMQFGGLKAVDNLSFQIQKGSLMGLIGPNGAGKTTVFNSLTGVYRPTSGDVLYRGEFPVSRKAYQINKEGESLVGKKPYQISRMGITRTFQNIRLFRNLSVFDNIVIAATQHIQYNLFDEIFRTKKLRQEQEKIKDQILDLLKIFEMDRKADIEAGGLPYGEQRKLEIVRALATRPQLLFLDEPAAGMNHSETHQLMNLISQIRKDFSVTILLIEHDMKLVMGICEKIIVLDHGVKIEEGNPEKVQNSKAVIEAYLGVSDLEVGQ